MPNLHHMEGVTQVLEILSREKKNRKGIAKERWSRGSGRWDEILNPCGRKLVKRIKIKWAWLGWMCFMVLSAMSCLHQLSCVASIVTGYSSSQGATHLSISSFGFRKCRTVCRLKCVVFVAAMKQWSWRVQEGPRPLKCDLGGLDVVCIICCTEIAVATFCLGEWLQCLLWCQSSF